MYLVISSDDSRASAWLGFKVLSRKKIYHNTCTGKTGFGGITVSPLLDRALD